MPYITLQVTQEGLVCSAFLGVSEPYRHALTLAGTPVPAPVPVRAMIDTGASCTCVDPTIIAPLNLTARNADVPVNTGSSGDTPHLADEYDTSLIIPPVSPQDVAFRRAAIPVVEMPLTESVGVDALIGRDILGDCLLVYDGRNGLFSLAY